ncbi:hypothetical protein [Actinomyces howellii]|uniref:Double zinc ribbon n=1 Tax=Actinomyces howellii TaxID=52771 RepID=A0A448HHS3_9ACTO|nr:hypothetical protein [Actinomyces howellii]VEG28802.1 Uncharacterised protein [Actinomyces howellii]
MTTGPQDGTCCPTCGRRLPDDQPICRECWRSGGAISGREAGAVALGAVARYRRPIVRVGTRIVRPVLKVTRFLED